MGFVSVGMPVCNCSISGMLVEFCDLNIYRTMAVVDEPDLSWTKLKCFAYSLRGLIYVCTSVCTLTPWRQVRARRASYIVKNHILCGTNQVLFSLTVERYQNVAFVVMLDSSLGHSLK